MSQNSAIEWTDATWNPVRGCTKVQPRLQVLLRRGVRGTLPRRTRTSFRAGLRSSTRSSQARSAAALATPAEDFRQLDERPLPRGRSDRVHRTCRDWMVDRLSRGPARWQDLYTEVRGEWWLRKHVNEVVRELRNERVVAAEKVPGRRFVPSANPVLRLSKQKT